MTGRTQEGAWTGEWGQACKRPARPRCHAHACGFGHSPCVRHHCERGSLPGGNALGEGDASTPEGCSALAWPRRRMPVSVPGAGVCPGKTVSCHPGSCKRLYDLAVTVLTAQNVLSLLTSRVPWWLLTLGLFPSGARGRGVAAPVLADAWALPLCRAPADVPPPACGLCPVWLSCPHGRCLHEHLPFRLL